MVFYIGNKNKNELLVLTGAVYSFVAYLTAFTLEVLFIIDLAKRSAGSTIILTATSSSTSSPPSTVQQQAHQLYQATNNEDSSSNAFEQARLAFQSMQTHVTISCLAITILYFVLFVASLILIIALILRSTFFILIWMCIMTTLYLPEFGLILYVSLYSWGIETRNGQTEFLFYLCRAALNVIFIYRAHRLFKEWSYEKNFFMLKSGNRFTGYDSPYFIGDSLSTTINPVFSGSTHNLDRYDQIREHIAGSPTPNQFHNQHQHVFSEFDMLPSSARGNRSRHNAAASLYSMSFDHKAADDDFYSRHQQVATRSAASGSPNKLRNDSNQRARKDTTDSAKSTAARQLQADQVRRQNSLLSINDNDEFADYEMNLDYRTLTHQRHYNNIEPINGRRQQQQQQVAVSREDNPTSGSLPGQATIGHSYSTQSLDRRHLRDLDYSLPDQVILRPLGHQPFEYLHRPGSSSNLASSQHLNTQPSSYSPNVRLASKRDEYDSSNYHRNHYRPGRFA